MSWMIIISSIIAGIGAGVGLSFLLIKKNIEKKSAELLEEAKNANLDIYPYKGGFFVLVKSNDPESDYEKLVDKNIYLIPMKNGLRVALCGITTHEVYGLAKKIKEVVNQ